MMAEMETTDGEQPSKIEVSFKKGERMVIKGILFRVDKFDKETIIFKTELSSPKGSIGA